MSVAILNGVTVKAFVEDEEAFKKCTNEYFKDLDVNGDGVLSRSEFRKGFSVGNMYSEFTLLAVGNDAGNTKEEMSSLYDIVFDKFDSHHSGTVDLEEFRSEMKESILAVARGIGNSPIKLHWGMIVSS
ncbi:hypothetical protein MKX01_023316 [Papaver californicum]|nr:hypothetical protein MKX01_023316 [Papaver californicum]